MKAVVKVREGKGNMELREMPEPTPGPQEVRVRVEAAGICGSDIHIWDSDIQIPMKPPVIVGHEFSGIIDQIGLGVEIFQPGDRVTSETAAIACGTCRYCRSGNYNLCHHRRGIGYWVNGAFARYIVVPVHRLHRIPDNVDLLAAALCEPLACCVHGVNELTTIVAGDIVVLTGPGPIGLLSLQCAKAEGGYVIVCGTSADKARLDLARQLGADRVVDLQQEDIKAIVGGLTDGLGADVVLECSGSAAAANFGLDIVRKAGQYTQIGLFGRPIQIDFEKVAYKEITVRGSFSQKWTAWKKALQLLALGKVATKPIISDIMPLDCWRDGFEKHRNKTGFKIVLKPE